MSAMSVLERELHIDEGLQALPFVAGIDGSLVITPRCTSCGWTGDTRAYTSTGRAAVAVSCSLHTCMAPKRGLQPSVLRR